jgi:hypothetical protein
MKKGALAYSNRAYIENVAGAPEWQRLLCPCQPGNPYKFKLSETTRLQVFSNDESERTHFFREKNKARTSSSSKAKEGSEQNKTTKGDYSE